MFTKHLSEGKDFLLNSMESQLHVHMKLSAEKYNMCAALQINDLWAVS